MRKQEKPSLNKKKENFRKLQNKRRAADSIWPNKNEKTCFKSLMTFTFWKKNKRNTLMNMLNTAKKKDIKEIFNMILIIILNKKIKKLFKKLKIKLIPEKVITNTQVKLQSNNILLNQQEFLVNTAKVHQYYKIQNIQIFCLPIVVRVLLAKLCS